MRKTSTTKTAAKTKAAKTAAAAVKTVEKVAEAATETVKAAAVPVEKVKEEVVKAVETAVEQAPAKKTTTAKKAVAETVYLQYLGKEINKADLMKQVKDIWTKELKNKVGDMKSVTLYLKPEENKAYYVINEEVTGSIDM